MTPKESRSGLQNPHLQTSVHRRGRADHTGSRSIPVSTWVSAILGKHPRRPTALRFGYLRLA
jgi:hypothetical protein